MSVYGMLQENTSFSPNPFQVLIVSVMLVVSYMHALYTCLTITMHVYLCRQYYQASIEST